MPAVMDGGIRLVPVLDGPTRTAAGRLLPPWMRGHAPVQGHGVPPARLGPDAANLLKARTGRAGGRPGIPITDGPQGSARGRDAWTSRGAAYRRCRRARRDPRAVRRIGDGALRGGHASCGGGPGHASDDNPEYPLPPPPSHSHPFPSGPDPFGVPHRVIFGH